MSSPPRKPRSRYPFTQVRHSKRHGWRWRGYADYEGRRIWTPSFATEAEAHEAVVILRDELGRAMGPTVSFEEACDLVTDDLETNQAPGGTLRWYRCQFRTLQQFFGKTLPLASLTEDHINDFKKHRMTVDKVSASTVGHNFRALRRVLNVAIKRRLITYNPLVAVTKPSVRQKRYPYLEFERIKQLLAKMRKQGATLEADVVAFFFHTGLRFSEFCRLTADDVDVNASRLWIRGKTEDEYQELNPPALSIAARSLTANPEGPLFGLRERAVRTLFDRWSAQLDEPSLKPHALRHSLATHLVRSGARIEIVKRVMRHKTLAMTMRYYHDHDDDARHVLSSLGEI